MIIIAQKAQQRILQALQQANQARANLIDTIETVRVSLNIPEDMQYDPKQGAFVAPVKQPELATEGADNGTGKQ